MNAIAFERAVALELERLLALRGVEAPLLRSNQLVTRESMSLTVEAGDASSAREVAVQLYRALGGAT